MNNYFGDDAILVVIKDRDEDREKKFHFHEIGTIVEAKFIRTYMDGESNYSCTDPHTGLIQGVPGYMLAFPNSPAGKRAIKKLEEKGCHCGSAT